MAKKHSHTIEFEVINYEAIQAELDEGLKNKAKTVINRTVSDALKRTPGWISPEVRKEYNIKKRDIDDTVVSKSKSAGRNSNGQRVSDISITYKGRLLTPLHFKMTPKEMPDLTDNRITVKLGGKYKSVRTRSPIVLRATIKKGQRKVIKGEYDTPIFLAENPKKEGQYIPFQRKGKERDKIVSIRSLSVPQMIENKTVEENIYKKINGELDKRLKHHMNRIIGKSK